MSAVALWVRSVLRRRIGATIALAVLAGLSVGIVGAAFQAARRADGAVQRSTNRSRSYDLVVQGCPPEAGNPDDMSFTQLVERCVGNEAARRFATEVVAPLPGVEGWTTVGTLVVGVLDSSAKNGWGRGVLVQAVGSPDRVGAVERSILVAGRFADQNAADEVVIGELAARAGHIHAGDKIRLASWKQEDLDAATAQGFAPQTDPFESRVVGIVRTGKDVQTAAGADLTGEYLPDGLYAGPGWVAAHGDGLAMYGYAVGVRLKDGPGGSKTFTAAIKEHSQGWSIAPSDTVNDFDVSSIERVVEAERQAVLISAAIGLIAVVVFVGLTLARQLRGELGEGAALSALGLTRGWLMVAGIIRALVVGLIATALAIATIITMSPVGPLGIARRLEYSHPIRFDWSVLGVVLVAVPVLFIAVAVVAAALAARSARRPVHVDRTASTMPLGAVPRAALNFVRGGSPRLAVAVGAVAVAGAIAAGALINSFDAVVRHPVNYGAWWDVAVGQYSDQSAAQVGIDTVSRNPNVADVAGFLEDSNTAKVDGAIVPYISLLPYRGHPETVMASGRAPARADEAALGAATARRLHKGIGDTIEITSAALSSLDKKVTITGIAVLNDPVTSTSNAGEGVVLHPDVAMILDISQVSQSIVVRFDPSVDRQAAIDSMFHDFPGSARLAQPQTDLANLQRLRFAPWLIAALVGALALASLIHALVTLLQRHARDLAVLGALGLTKRQRRRVGVAAGLAIGIGCVVVGVPVGLVLGRWIWRVVTRRISIPSGPVMAWLPTVSAPLVALVIAAGVATVATAWVTRRSPAVQLHSE